MFIDFRKAFDIVCSHLLLIKLQHCFGFCQQSLNLIRDFFTNRSQHVKVNDCLSSSQPISLGVAQGSSLGPLFFLLFINDLPFFLINFLTTLFADDTTLVLEHKSLDNLLNLFYISFPYLTKWCTFNMLDINWKKTVIMFITNKYRQEIPQQISVNGHTIQVVSSFKLLGVTIDNKLNFNIHVTELKKNINKRLFSIKRLFFLSLRVKLLFLKTFIFPYFDYCSTITLYFPKETIQRLANCYNFCIFKLIGTKSILNFTINNSNDFNRWNNLLESYGLIAYQHRIIVRISVYIHKIFNSSNSPSKLLNSFVFNRDLNKHYKLRNINHLFIPPHGFNKNGTETFTYFFSNLLNAFYLNDIDLNHNLFKQRVQNNINIIFLKFIIINKKYDINFKRLYNKTK